MLGVVKPTRRCQCREKTSVPGRGCQDGDILGARIGFRVNAEVVEKWLVHGGDAWRIGSKRELANWEL